MKETTDALQMLLLLLTLLLQLVMLLGIVYSFKFIIPALRSILEQSEATRLSVSTTNTLDQAGHASELRITASSEKDKDTPKKTAPLRYRCRQCKARLPEAPLCGRIEGDKNLLDFKCGRCGKETTINPAETLPI